MCVCEHTAWHKHLLELDAPRCLQADRAIQKALREADEQLRKMQARASSHADTSQALSEAAAACCGRLPPEAAAEAFLGTCAQLDVLRALRDRASAAEQLSAAATRLVSPPLHLPCSPPAAPHLTRFGMPGSLVKTHSFPFPEHCQWRRAAIQAKGPVASVLTSYAWHVVGVFVHGRVSLLVCC